MKNKLLYVGITHETAPVEERTHFVLDPLQKNELTDLLKSKFSITALVIITTCNRTEIYFESKTVSPQEVRDTFLMYVNSFHKVQANPKGLLILDNTIDSANHLLQVANGLRSAVIGDKQIINQVKGAYLQALQKKRQGSLLERAFQAVFRSHKRIYKESLYQHGSASTAYSSLKLVEHHFTKDEMKHLSLLIVGAGEIAEDLLKYLPKFEFTKVSIANRTEENAIRLAKHYNIQSYPWQQVMSNNFATFDVIISAVSHRKHLIKNADADGKKRLWVDLAMPSNIDENIANDFNHLYNIDKVASLVSHTRKAQLESIPIVEAIIEEELNVFTDWLKKDKFRAFLRSHKQQTKQAFLSSVPETITTSLSTLDIEYYAEKLANRMVRKSAQAFNEQTNKIVVSQ